VDDVIHNVMTRYQGITHITTGGISPILPNLNNLKNQLPEIALAHHNTAFNSAMKCTLFEAMYGLRAKTITEAGASPRLHITAEEGTELTGLQEPDYNKWNQPFSK
jgi:hypothetical protein